MSKIIPCLTFFFLFSFCVYGEGGDRMAPVGDRWGVSRILTSIFSSKTDDANEELKEILFTNIIKQTQSFGGQCNLQAGLWKEGITHYWTWLEFTRLNKEEFCYSTQDLEVKPTLPISTMRMAWVFKACFAIYKNDSLMENAKRKICEDCNEFSTDIVKKAYQLFFPYNQLSGVEAKEFKNIICASSSSCDETSLNEWILALCMDPNWQVF